MYGCDVGVKLYLVSLKGSMLGSTEDRDTCHVITHPSHSMSGAGSSQEEERGV